MIDATVAMSRRRRAREERNPPKIKTRDSVAPVPVVVGTEKGMDSTLMDAPGSFDGVAGIYLSDRQ